MRRKCRKISDILKSTCILLLTDVLRARIALRAGDMSEGEMMNWNGLACVALGGALLAACATQTTSAPSFVTPEDEAANASREYFNCIRDADRQLDDRTSAVSTVAMTIEGKCAGAYASLKDILSRNMGSDEKLKLETDMDSKQPAQIENLVQLQRNGASPSLTNN
jgi:hypothetical protein